MPNGNPDEPNAIGARSRFWRCVWYIGDTSYYLGLFSAVILLIAAIILPPILAVRGQHFETWRDLLLHSAVLAFVGLCCFPVGIALDRSLKALARRRTGVPFTCG